MSERSTNLAKARATGFSSQRALNSNADTNDTIGPTVMNLKAKTYLWYIVILRVYIGYYLLQQGTLKYLRSFPQSDWINRQIGDLNQVEIYAWYKSFLIDVVVPHRELFGYLVALGEIL